MEVPIGSCVRSCQVLNRFLFYFDYFLLEPMTILSESLQDPLQVPICDQVRFVLLYEQQTNCKFRSKFIKQSKKKGESN